MFMEKKVELIKRWPRNLPVVFFVQIPQANSGGKNLVQMVCAGLSDVFGEPDGNLFPHCSKLLDGCFRCSDHIRLFGSSRAGGGFGKSFVSRFTAVFRQRSTL